MMVCLDFVVGSSVRLVVAVKRVGPPLSSTGLSAPAI